MRKQNGITLVALVITIIILLILAGISIQILTGNEGIINKSIEGRKKQNKVEEREKLELLLMQLEIDKRTKSEYNENEYIDNKIIEIGMQVDLEKDIVKGKNVEFKIDRKELKIIDEINEENVEENKIKEELPFLITTGNQYIHTGIIPNQDTKIEMKIQLLARKSQFLFGSRIAIKENTYSLAYTTEHSEGEGYRDDYCDEQVMTKNYWEGIHIVKKDKNEFYIDNELIYTHKYKDFSTSNNTSNDLTLFTSNTSGTIGKTYCAELKFYYCKIWDGDILIRDFIPIIDNNGKVCIYEKIENKVYYPEYGEKEEDFLRNSENVELRSLTSTGTQYIDTEYKANQDTTIEIKCRVNSNTNQFIYGGRTNNKEKIFCCAYIGENSSGALRFDYNTIQTTYSNYKTGNIYTIKQSKNEFYVNGVKKGQTTYNNFEGEYNVYLLGVNTSGTLELPSLITIYYCKIWDGDILVRDFVPMINSENKIFLYDRINEKEYHSLEGTNFILTKD